MPRCLSRLLALLAVAALVMGACGNDDDAEPDDTTTTTEAPSVDDGDDDEAGGDEPGPDPDDTTTTTATTNGGSTDPVEIPDFAAVGTACEALATFAEFADQVDAVFDDMDGREADRAFGAAQAAYARAGQLAPDDLVDDFALIAAGFAEFRAWFAEFDYDIDALEAAEAEDPDRFADAIIESTEFDAAFASTAAYANEECDLDPFGS